MREVRGQPVVFVAALAFGCVHSRPQPSAETCAPVESPVPMPDDFATLTLAGDHMLVMVATSGARAGARVVGRLHLAPSAPNDSARGPDGTVVRSEKGYDRIFPLIGSADVTLADVGAISEHDPRSADRVYPGVAVFVLPAVMRHPGKTAVSLLLGSARRDFVQVLEGAGTTLDVSHIDGPVVAGKWRSGAFGTTATGHFCIRRTRP